MSLIGTIIGLTALAISSIHVMIAHRVPPIHDITTDTENTPKIVSLSFKLRKGMRPTLSNTGGNRLQSCNVWHITDMDHSYRWFSGRALFFELAFETAQKMGWEIANADTDNGLIEAPQPPSGFGF